MDSILIFPPGPSIAGSQLQIGTYLMADPGANYGAQGLLQSLRSGNALSDGGRFSFRYAPVRQMAIPLLLRDVPGQTLLQTESLMRVWTTAGAAVAVQPETIPSGQAVFFDVLDGRWEPDYSTFENRIGRRKGTLFLDTQPFGYWPTEILIASSASVGFPGALAIPGGSLIGDVPPLAHVTVMPTVASNYQAAAGFSWFTDMAAISLAAQPSFTPFIAPAAFSAATLSAAGPFLIVPTLTADAFAPASQAQRWTVASVAGGFAGGAWAAWALSASSISSALEPAYRGRFRVFSFVKTVPSSWNVQTIVDAGRGPSAMFGALASANQLASAAAVPIPGGVTASPGYLTLDMGEITLPPAGSGIQMGESLRLWVNAGASAPAGSGQLYFGGMYLLPVDGAAGIVAKGLAIPSINGAITGGMGGFANPTQGGVEFNGNQIESALAIASFPASAPQPGQALSDLRTYYRGVPLRLGASTNQLLMLTADRAMGATSGLARQTVKFSQVSVSYRPTFQFMYGL